MFRNIFKNKLVTFTLANFSSNCYTIKMSEKFLEPLKQNHKRFKRILFLKQLFEEDGHELRIAGGAVRDILRGKEPADIDFATTSRPEKTLEIMKKREDVLRIIVTPSGERHGTVSAKFKEVDELSLNFKKQKLDGDIATDQLESPKYDEELPFEVTTLRCDKITDGRHAEVEFITDWKTDAERRDLTINAMFLTLDGELIDYYNGRDDLENGRVRFVGDAKKRINEDYLRILRFFRFWSIYGKLDPDVETIEIIKKNLQGLEGISGERLWTEMKKIFSSLSSHRAVKLMINCEVLQYLGLDHSQNIYPGYVEDAIASLQNVENNIRFWEGNDKIDSKTKEFFPVIAFASILKTKTQFQKAYTRLKWSNLERDFIKYVIEYKDQQQITEKELKYLLALTAPPEVAILRRKLKAFLIYSGKQEDLYDQVDTWPIPKFPVSGNIVAVEFKKHKVPPKKIKLILQMLREEWARSDFNLTADELVDMIDSKVNEVE